MPRFAHGGVGIGVGSGVGVAVLVGAAVTVGVGVRVGSGVIVGVGITWASWLSGPLKGSSSPHATKTSPTKSSTRMPTSINAPHASPDTFLRLIPGSPLSAGWLDYSSAKVVSSHGATKKGAHRSTTLTEGLHALRRGTDFCKIEGDYTRLTYYCPIHWTRSVRLAGERRCGESCEGM